ncbi:LysR family transcriptional regulator [Vibrio sp. CAU 1672]|uniref:LysR family transcriptional regulator n=1 Tax=Vibrio sp. CAU 1672 TaxID=3032594 RepID=UPI0023D9D4A0|nr:LysR family transcriptional regulator [Vibrio sp. CAU 1672]MDF2152463.1 LysR family transcriptional regulator [Vibrio sp. CAU 1672]
MFTIEQLQAFVITCETGSFSAAGRKLGKAQSVVSQHIINMEIDCGVELFDRRGRYPLLTEPGKQLLPDAQASLDQFNRLSNRAAHLARTTTNQFVLAVDDGMPPAYVPELLARLSQQYPLLQIGCLTASSPDIIDLVASERATTGVIFSETSLPEQLDFSTLGHIAFDVFVAKTHPLARSDIRHVDQFKQHRQLVIRSKSTHFSSLNQAFSPDIWYADNYYLLLELTKQGFGWSVLPVHLAERLPNQLVSVSGDFADLSWHANIDIIQHQKWHADPVHQQARLELQALFRDKQRINMT